LSSVFGQKRFDLAAPLIEADRGRGVTDIAPVFLAGNMDGLHYHQAGRGQGGGQVGNDVQAPRTPAHSKPPVRLLAKRKKEERRN
jgi:hypothetical protein